jgi:hypothetical protein
MQLDFTRDGRFLISVGLDDNHNAGTSTVRAHAPACRRLARSEVSVALRTSAAAIIVRGHMGDVNSVACDGDSLRGEGARVA